MGGDDSDVPGHAPRYLDVSALSMLKYVVILLVTINYGCSNRTSDLAHKIELTETEILVDGSILAQNELQEGVDFLIRNEIRSANIIVSDNSGVIPLVCFGIIEEKVGMNNRYWWMCYKCNKLSEIKQSTDQCDRCNDKGMR